MGGNGTVGWPLPVLAGRSDVVAYADNYALAMGSNPYAAPANNSLKKPGQTR